MSLTFKKLSLVTLMFTVVTSSAISETCLTLPDDALNLENITSVPELIGASNVLNDSTNLSDSLLKNSEDLLSLSKSLLSAGPNVNTQYVEAMLSLSQDILAMADKIGEMADRILDMADKIGEMADRIIETQLIQNENVALTQANILEAQENLKKLLAQ